LASLTYIGYRSKILGKGYGIKCGASKNNLGNTFANIISNALWSWWEPCGTHWEQQNINDPHPFPKEKKNWASWSTFLA
jgi:hypothetical protein